MPQLRLVIPDPYPTQQDFFLAEGEIIGFGGSLGGGKSWAARTKAELLAYEYPGIQMLLIRKTLGELRGNHILPLMEHLQTEHPDKNQRFATYRDAKKEFMFPNGSRLELGYCEHENDIYRYQGQSFDVIFMEEATLLWESVYHFLRSRNRLSGRIKDNKPFKPRMYLTCNPGNIGHQWVKNLFIDNPQCNVEGSGIVFIRSSVYDNKFLMENDPDYIAKLESLPEKQKQAFLYGDWNAFEGQFFEEFDEKEHIIDPKNFPIQPNWKIYRTRDYGFDMLACYWVAIDEKGNGYVFKEIYQPNLITSAAGDLINSYNREHIHLDLAPPDLWNRQKDSGRSIADIFQQDCGHYLTKASNDRENGWAAVREWLRKVKDVKIVDGKEVVYEHPKLRIYSTCKNLIRTLPLLIFDPKNPNDCLTEPHEITHCNDSLRYFCSSWTYAPSYIPTEKKDNWIQKAIKNNQKINNDGNGEFVTWY